MSKRKWMSTVGMVALLMAAGLILGCGVKSDPTPPKVIRIKPVSDLEMRFMTEGILLRWSIPGEPSLMARVRIYRSELETDRSACPGCPREYVLMADLASGDSRMQREDGNRLMYKDLLVKPGRLYGYYVISCDRSGTCSEASNQVEGKYLRNSVPDR